MLEDRLLIVGPRYSAVQQGCVPPFNDLIGQAKTSIWLTRRNKTKGTGSSDVELERAGDCSKIEFA